MSRQTIRAAFKTVVETVYSGLIYDTRLSDSRDDPEYISIYLTSGEVDTYSTFTETRSEVVIEFSKQAATDSELDTVADQIINAALNNQALKAEVKNSLFTGFEYETRENGQHVLRMTFNILY